MKLSMKYVGLGALAGAVLLAALWLLCGVSRALPFSLVDGCFFLGLGLVLVGLLLLLPAGRSARFSAGTTGSALPSVNLDIAMEKGAPQMGRALMFPLLCVGAGAVNLAASLVLYLVWFGAA